MGPNCKYDVKKKEIVVRQTLRFCGFPKSVQLQAAAGVGQTVRWVLLVLAEAGNSLTSLAAVEHRYFHLASAATVMSAPETSADDRRSSRIRAKIPLIVYADDDSGTPCDAVLVNAHGGALQGRKKIPVGDIVVLRHTDGSKASATCSVRSCVPLGTSKNEWLIGVELDHAGNFWKVQNPPADWGVEGTQSASAKAGDGKALRGANAAAQSELAALQKQLAEAVASAKARLDDLASTAEKVKESVKKAAAAARDEAVAAIEAAGRARNEKLDQFATMQTRKAESIVQAAVESLDEIITKKMDGFGKRCDELVQTVMRRNSSASDVLESGKKPPNGRDEF